MSFFKTILGAVLFVFAFAVSADGHGPGGLDSVEGSRGLRSPGVDNCAVQVEVYDGDVCVPASADGGDGGEGNGGDAGDAGDSGEGDSGEGDSGEGDSGEGDSGEGDSGEGHGDY